MIVRLQFNPNALLGHTVSTSPGNFQAATGAYLAESLEDFGDDAGADGAASFADGEAASCL
ncbi:MAG: hypothetical protein RML36_11630, partial [Anaerolineae bacterium]|nr:hypothetical protein [Anaerolineae bacterium]